MNKEDIKHNIIFDIDSSSIGVLVFEVNNFKKNIYKEVFTLREFIIKENNINFDLFFDKTIKTFRDVASSAYKYSGNNIGDIYLNVSSPWSSSQIRNIYFGQDKDFIFTKDIESSIVKKELSKALHYTTDFYNQNKLSIIERETLDLFPNGYLSYNPYGKKINYINIRSIVSVMSEYTNKSFINVVENYFHLSPIFFSNKFMNYKSIKNLFINNNDVLSIDISGEVTEIILIIKNQLKKIGTIPVGLNHIIRSISKDMKLSFLRAESILIMYQNNELDEKYKKIIDGVMKKSFFIWFKDFYEFLGEVSGEFIIPSTLHVLSPNDTYNWFREWLLKTDEINEYLHLNKKLSILDSRFLWKDNDDIIFNKISDENLAMCLGFVLSNYEKK